MPATVSDTSTITAEDVRALRRSLYNDGIAEKGEVQRLFSLGESAEDFDPSWRELFIEAVADYVVEQMTPQGHVSAENAEWLMAQIDRDGVVRSDAEVELLVKILEKAQSSPERLVAYALSQIKEAVLHGEGPLARGGTLERGRVNREEAELVRRILHSFGGDQNIAVTRAEAEVLFDINDAAAAAENDPAWNDLFVKAIANCMMAASGYAVPTRQEALRREAWLDSSSGGVVDFLGRMAAGGLRGMLDAYRQPGEDPWAARNAQVEGQIASAEMVTAEEAEWLARRIGRDGLLHDNEKALLRFMREEAPSVHPSLRSLIAKAA